MTKLTEDRGAQAEALRIAEDWLKRQGWKFTPSDVGKRAREILDAMEAPAGRASITEGSADER